MFFLRRPSPDALDRLFEQAQGADVTYAEVGATKGNGRPSGYRHDLDEGLLGAGPETFERQPGLVLGDRGSARQHLDPGPDVRLPLSKLGNGTFERLRPGPE